MSKSASAVRTRSVPKREERPLSKQPVGAPDRAVTNEKYLLENSLSYTIRRTQVRCDVTLMRHLNAEISPARFAALTTIGANPGISQRSLGSLLGIAAPSVVKVVDDLQKLGLLRRDKINGRLHSLQLTNKGLTDLRRYMILVDQFESEIATSLTIAERELLIALLKKVARGASH